MPARIALMVAAALVLGSFPHAVAADFSPTIDFTLSPKKVKANPTVDVVVQQDMGEEELASVKLTIDDGFKLAQDAALENGEQLGSGRITIHAGPRCAGQTPVSAPVIVPVNIVERDRTSAEAADGVKAVYVVDLRPVTTIDLLVRGSTANGWTLTGQIPPNNFTCPPFTFDASFFKKAEESGTKIFKNPSKAGKYTLSATFEGLTGTKRTLKETVRITK